MEDGEEVILARELPADGRARAWIDGRAATVSALEERARGLCTILGQHEHQSLLSTGAVRTALDRWAGLDDHELSEARRSASQLAEEQRRLGGDPTEVARELSLLRHEVAEIEGAQLSDPEELDTLLSEVSFLESARHLRVLLASGIDALDSSEVGPRPALGSILNGLEDVSALADTRSAVESALVHLDEAESALHRALERVEEDPGRLSELNERLSLLNDLCRRYGPSLTEVMDKGSALAERLGDLEQAEGRRGEIDELLGAARDEVQRLEAVLLEQRSTAAPKMANEIESRLGSLALERAVVTLSCSGPAGEEVELLFSANPGLAAQPVAKVASGGELARLMLALHLTMPEGPPTMVFDEVDAGVGGATAVTLAKALKDLARDRQVVVVTHLAQVAAAADVQVVVTKVTEGEATSARADAVEDEERIAEIARMLSGHPDSSSARTHAAELIGSLRTA